MKITTSFLFRYVVCAGFVFFNLRTASSQISIDSTTYYYNLALNPKESTDLGLAYNYFVEHKELCLEKNYIEGAIHDLSLLTIIQKESGYYHDSEASAIEAISLLEQLDETDYTTETKITLYNELGKVNRALLDYDRALLYYNKAIDIANSPQQFNIITNNRAFIYSDKKDFAKALVEFQKAYEIGLKINNEKEIARNLDNIAFVKSKLKHPDALSLLEIALQKRLQLNDVEGIYASYMHLFEYYSDRKDKQNALLNLKNALAVANTLNSDSYKLDVLSEFVNLNTDSIVTAYKTLNDTKKLDNLLTENKYASKKYDFNKKELELQKNKLQKERYQLFVVFFLVLAALSYVLIKVKHKKEKIQQVFKTETRISKKIHDELANDMSDILSYVETELQTTEENKSKLLHTLEDVYLRTRDISTETANIDFENFSDSLKYLLIQHNKHDVKVIISNIDVFDWQRIPEHKKLAIYRCLQELMVNMKKHSDAKLVSIVFKKQKNKHEIWYTDDGQGCSIENIKQSGLENAEYRIKEIGGRFTFETSEGRGFKAIIIF